MTNEQPTTQPTQPAQQPAQQQPAKQAAKPSKAQDRADSLRKRGAGVPAEDMDFDVDEESGTVSTSVGGVGWPEGAENEEGTQADGTVRKDDNS